MSLALEAAFRLACELPSRTHRKADPPPKVYRAHGLVPKEKVEQMNALEAKRIPRKKMARILRVSEETIRRKLGNRGRTKHRGGW